MAATDKERREIAARLRKCTLSTNYTQAQGGGWSHLCDMALAVGLKQEDRPTAWDLAQRLADLIEPTDGFDLDHMAQVCFECLEGCDEPEHTLYEMILTAISRYKRGESGLPSSALVDRDALLALADEISGTSCDKVDGELTVDLITVWGWAQAIREALGVQNA